MSIRCLRDIVKISLLPSMITISIIRTMYKSNKLRGQVPALPHLPVVAGQEETGREPVPLLAHADVDRGAIVRRELVRRREGEMTDVHPRVHGGAVVVVERHAAGRAAHKCHGNRRHGHPVGVFQEVPELARHEQSDNRT